MSVLTDGLAWSGVDVTVILFAAFSPDTPAAIIPPSPLEATAPDIVRDYALEDLDGYLPAWSCHEFDLTYKRLPPDLEAVISAWAAAALDSGAGFVWFAFEGSFSFLHILTADIADLVFAVGTSEGVELALDDDYRHGPAWAARLEQIRTRLQL